LHNQRLGKVLLKTSYSNLNYFYFFFKSTRYRSEIVGSSTGSTVKHTAPKKILSVKQVFHGQLENMFNEFVRPLLAEIDRNSEEQNCLEEMRDTLLPRLLSGEIELNQTA
ncbi:MAG: hypothetical protein KAU27_13530, partial [Desulfuromonadales bacterium]|nr:hypothetical protein [Desulfuromonadales bacterium]